MASPLTPTQLYGMAALKLGFLLDLLGQPDGSKADVASGKGSLFRH